jgi:hypothetical protein
MGSLGKLIASFFSTPTNYAEMLTKLAALAFVQVLVITFLLRQIPQIDDPLQKFEMLLPISPKYNPAGILIAFGIALLTHVAHLHNRISDLLGIRRHFDIEYILRPLAQLVGAKLTARQIAALNQDQERNRVMRDVFYKFASSRAQNPLVDRHDIEHALGQWVWFWALVEGSVFLFCGAVVAFSFGGTRLGIALYFAAFASALIAAAFSRRLPGYARAEIEAIASDNKARGDVKAAFDALIESVRTSS